MRITGSPHGRRFHLLGWLTLAVSSLGLLVQAAAPLPHGRVVFLGDSITYGGQYVEFIEAGLRLQFGLADLEVLNLGLPSETVSGLSEPGHAGGAFPRPDLHERLERVLAKTKPQVVLACYGMNDGIYYPFAADRFARFQAGMRRLHDRVVQSAARLIHITPSPFDPLPLHGRTLPDGRTEYPQPFAGYDEVLDRYSGWLLSQRSAGWEVVDAHGPMNRFLAARRRNDPAFTFAADGVHPDTTGHWLIARAVLDYFGASKAMVSLDKETALFEGQPAGAAVLQLVQQRQRLLKDPWLTFVGHQRPGMAKGSELAEAERQAADFDARLRALLPPRAEGALSPAPNPR